MITIVRNYVGDAEALAAELKSICAMSEVEVRPGTLRVAGKHSRNIRQWMEMMGF